MTRLTEIAKIERLKEAWFSLKRNKRSFGIDEVTMGAFGEKLDENLLNISIQLAKGTYKFSPVRGVAIPKPGSSKQRPIRVATIADRLVQKAIEINIAPTLESKFNIKNDASYAYIKERGLLKAVGDINRLIHEGYSVCYKGDIENYFGEVNRQTLLDDMVLPALGKDTSLNDLIKASLEQEVGNIQALRKKYGTKAVDQIFPETSIGIPQGGILSPLFSNIFLKDLDETMLAKGFKIIRYADDFIVLCKSLEEALEANEIAQKIIIKLNLKLHPLAAKTILKSLKQTTKTYITSSNDFEFLGIHFKGGKLYPSLASFKKTGNKLRAVVSRKALKEKTLSQKLLIVDQIYRSWATTYWFTSFDSNVKSSYSNLNRTLFTVVSAILNHHGLIFKSEKLLSSKKLKALGFGKFESLHQAIQVKYFNDKNKTKLVKIFETTREIG